MKPLVLVTFYAVMRCDGSSDLFATFDAVGGCGNVLHIRGSRILLITVFAEVSVGTIW